MLASKWKPPMWEKPAVRMVRSRLPFSGCTKLRRMKTCSAGTRHAANTATLAAMTPSVSRLPSGSCRNLWPCVPRRALVLPVSVRPPSEGRTARGGRARRVPGAQDGARVLRPSGDGLKHGRPSRGAHALRQRRAQPVQLPVPVPHRCRPGVRPHTPVAPAAVPPNQASPPTRSSRGTQRAQLTAADEGGRDGAEDEQRRREWPRVAACAGVPPRPHRPPQLQLQCAAEASASAPARHLSTGGTGRTGRTGERACTGDVLQHDGVRFANAQGVGQGTQGALASPLPSPHPRPHPRSCPRAPCSLILYVQERVETLARRIGCRRRGAWRPGRCRRRRSAAQSRRPHARSGTSTTTRRGCR